MAESKNSVIFDQYLRNGTKYGQRC